jgi:hypothetical protein
MATMVMRAVAVLPLLRQVYLGRGARSRIDLQVLKQALEDFASSGNVVHRLPARLLPAISSRADSSSYLRLPGGASHSIG